MKTIKLITVIIIILVFNSCSKEKRSNKAGKKMQEFVINISKYARNFDSDFIIIPQNGPELVYNDLDNANGLNPIYINACSGLGNEEIFYNGSLDLNDYSLNILREAKTSLKILNSDYLSYDYNIADDIKRNANEGFLCFPRCSTNYYYNQIPDSVINENTNDITTLNDAQNYLYAIGINGEFPTKDSLINTLKNTNFDIILIDLFFNDIELTKKDVEQLKIKANGGKRLVISYMNIGSAENYRYYWKDSWRLHHPLWLKKPYEGYEDEIWVKFWKQDWQDIILGNDNSYTKKIINASFDGVYLDNVEAYTTYILIKQTITITN